MSKKKRPDPEWPITGRVIGPHEVQFDQDVTIGHDEELEVYVTTKGDDPTHYVEFHGARIVKTDAAEETLG